MLRYIGSFGTGSTVTESAAQLAERMYRNGWRWVTITDSVTGAVVGGVGRHTAQGKRVWWGDDTPPPPPEPKPPVPEPRAPGRSKLRLAPPVSEGPP
jgi:hypothetical protein